MREGLIFPDQECLRVYDCRLDDLFSREHSPRYSVDFVVFDIIDFVAQVVYGLERDRVEPAEVLAKFVDQLRR